MSVLLIGAYNGSILPSALIVMVPLASTGIMNLPTVDIDKNTNTKANKTIFFIFNQNTILHVSLILALSNFTIEYTTISGYDSLPSSKS